MSREMRGEIVVIYKVLKTASFVATIQACNSERFYGKFLVVRCDPCALRDTS